MADTLFSLFPNPQALLGLEPEELGGVVLELAPGVLQNGMFNSAPFMVELFGTAGKGYDRGYHDAVNLALAEAMSWLVTEGLFIRAPGQPAEWYVMTRRARSLRTRSDVRAFRKGRILPVDLLQPSLAGKVWPLFLRGDHDVAVFQAFKVVEVAVRAAANARGAGYPDDLVGVSLMRKAFHADSGPLREQSLVPAKREAEVHLFAGAIGRAKNPPSHRDVNLDSVEAARLIVFASYLLAIVEQRLQSA